MPTCRREGTGLEGTTASPKTIAGGTPISAGKGSAEEHHRVRGERNARAKAAMRESLRLSLKIVQIWQRTQERRGWVSRLERCVSSRRRSRLQDGTAARLCLTEGVDFPRRRGLVVL